MSLLTVEIRSDSHCIYRSTTSWRELWKWCKLILRTSPNCFISMSMSLKPLV